MGSNTVELGSQSSVVRVPSHELERQNEEDRRVWEWWRNTMNDLNQWYLDNLSPQENLHKKEVEQYRIHLKHIRDSFSILFYLKLGMVRRWRVENLPHDVVAEIFKKIQLDLLTPIQQIRDPDGLLSRIVIEKWNPKLLQFLNELLRYQILPENVISNFVNQGAETRTIFSYITKKTEFYHSGPALYLNFNTRTSLSQTHIMDEIFHLVRVLSEENWSYIESSNLLSNVLKAAQLNLPSDLVYFFEKFTNLILHKFHQFPSSEFMKDVNIFFKQFIEYIASPSMFEFETLYLIKIIIIKASYDILRYLMVYWGLFGPSKLWEESIDEEEKDKIKLLESTIGLVHSMITSACLRWFIKKKHSPIGKRLKFDVFGFCFINEGIISQISNDFNISQHYIFNHDLNVFDENETEISIELHEEIKTRIEVFDYFELKDIQNSMMTIQKLNKIYEKQKIKTMLSLKNTGKCFLEFMERMKSWGIKRINDVESLDYEMISSSDDEL